jgi:Glycosyltransferase
MRQKCDFVGNALALLFPIDWIEPFGLVMIEAMSSGTPVIAWRNGSVPEVIREGEGGFIVESIDEAIEAVERAKHLDRAIVRTYFESRFTAEKMAASYVAAFERLLAKQKPDLRVVSASGATSKPGTVPDLVAAE